MGLQQIVELERRVTARVCELTQGQPAQFNIAPLMDLVRQAYLMGYEIVPATAAEGSEA